MSISLVALGLASGISSLILLSNYYGGTDTLGLLMFGLSGWLLVAGILHLFLRLRNAILAGALAAPVSVALLFVAFWTYLFSFATPKEIQLKIAENVVSQIEPARQMNELFEDCQNYITYGTDKGRSSVLFNSVACFGDRYELTMQVPVEIQSETSGSVVGEPRFYLNEVSEIRVSASGQVGASFSSDFRFGASEWSRLYEADGDWSVIGFEIDTNSVPDFQKYTEASRGPRRLLD